MTTELGPTRVEFKEMAERFGQIRPSMKDEPQEVPKYLVRVDQSGVPKRLMGRSFENYEGHVKEVEKIRSAIDIGDSVLLTGGCGSGKSHLAVASMRQIWIEWTKTRASMPGQVRRMVFLPVVELLHELKASFSSDQDSGRILDKYSWVDLLVLDDLGAEKSSDWSGQLIYQLIDRRYREILQTVVTSNLSQRQISDQIDDRVASRISEMGIVVNLGSEDYRVLQSRTPTRLNEIEKPPTDNPINPVENDYGNSGR